MGATKTPFEKRWPRWLRVRSPPKHRASRQRSDPLTRRALCAAAIIVVGFGAIAVGSLIDAEERPNGASAHAAEESAGAPAIVDAVLSGEDPYPAEDAAPAWFEEEFFSPETFFDIRCNEDETVVSLVSAEPATSTLRACVDAMERRGWTALSTGKPLMKTMVRKEGNHSWAMLWAVDVGGQCSIIVQTLPSR